MLVGWECVLGKGRMILRRIAPLFLLLADALLVEMIRKLRRDAAWNT